MPNKMYPFVRKQMPWYWLVKDIDSEHFLGDLHAGVSSIVFPPGKRGEDPRWTDAWLETIMLMNQAVAEKGNV